MRADGLVVDGTVLLSRRFQATGQISLNGARIARNLNCENAVLQNPGGYSLSASGARITGSLYTGEGFRSHGAFRPEGTRISGHWKAGDGARFVATASTKPGWKPTKKNSLELRAIIANGLSVLASVVWNADCHVQGTLELTTAKIGGDFKCDGACLSFPGEEILKADGISISGGLFFRETRVNGLLRLAQATIGRGLFADGITFDLTGRCEDRQGVLSVYDKEIRRNA